MGLADLEGQWEKPTTTEMEWHPDGQGDRPGDGVRRYLWTQIVCPSARYFLQHLQEDVDDSHREKVKEWLCNPTKTAKAIMCPMDEVFRVHLTLALVLIEYRGPGVHWVSEGPNPLITKLEGGDPELTAELQRLASDFSMPVGLVRDLALELAGGSKRASDGAIIAPFALVLKGERAAGALAQFRFERVPGGQGECYITPEQAFARMDRDFEESVFHSARKAVDRLLEGEKDTHRDCDVRVRIEAFDPTNTRAPFGLFDPEGQGKPPRFFKEELAGRSAGGAAAWGLHFVRTRKHPDPGLIVLALCDECGGVTPINAEIDEESLRHKVRAIAGSGCFDTIAVAGKRRCVDVKKELVRLKKSGRICAKRIE